MVKREAWNMLYRNRQYSARSRERRGTYYTVTDSIVHGQERDVEHIILLKNIEQHLLPQFVNTIQVICLQNVYKINLYF